MALPTAEERRPSEVQSWSLAAEQRHERSYQFPVGAEMAY